METAAEGKSEEGLSNEENKMERIIPTERRCYKCGITKPISEFYPANKAQGIYHYSCKECDRIPPSTYITVTEKVCGRCKILKPVTEFNRARMTNDGYFRWCKKCVEENHHVTTAKYRELNDNNAIDKLENSTMTKECRNCNKVKPISEFNLHRTNKDGHSCYCTQCNMELKKEDYNKYKLLPSKEKLEKQNKHNESRIQERNNMKAEVFAYYSNSNPAKCVNPFHVHNEDVTDLDVLSIDHINGDGYKDKINGHRFGGTHFYRWLKMHNYPSGFQVLCMNCQLKKKRLFKENPMPKKKIT